MSYTTLRPQIRTLLSSISKIESVKGYPTLTFSGFPAGYVVPSDNSADYGTTTENTRIYAFMVRLFYETKSGGVDNAIQAMEDLVDTVLDTFDREDLKGASTRTIGIDLPSSYTYINIWAHPTSFGEVEGENLLMAEISVRVRISVDVS